MKSLLVTALLLVGAQAFAETCTVRWVAPTENVDGSPIQGALTFGIHAGPGASSLVRIATVPDPAREHSWQCPAGTHVAVTAIDSEGDESAYSNIIAPTQPNAPTITVNITVSIGGTQ